MTAELHSMAARYAADGFVLLRGLLAPDHVAACLAALSALADDPALEGGGPSGPAPFVALEAAGAAGAARIDRVRKLGNFIDVDPALYRAAMGRRLHAALDALVGPGRVLIQEMALLKPPGIGGEKRWHQDAAYFRVCDPGDALGVWIALDPATRANGCMELIPGSQRGGPVPHLPDADINQCAIAPSHVEPSRRVAVEMAPGDALVFHSLVHHFTAANRSDQRRRALQFHYTAADAEWTDLAGHRALFHDASGAYAGCTVPKGEPLTDAASYRPSRLRPVTPVD